MNPNPSEPLKLAPAEVGTDNSPNASIAAANLSQDEDRLSDDLDITHAVELVFEQESVHRRKSSLVSSAPRRPTNPRRTTKCYVHQLLDAQRLLHDGSMTPNHEGEVSIGRERDKDPEGTTLNGSQQKEHTQSRLLTKKQLSDMALGIRALSKKLAHLQLKLKVKNVFLLAKAHDSTLIHYTRELAEWLLSKKEENYTVYVENTLECDEDFDTKGLLGKNPCFDGRLRWWDNELCARSPQTFDIVIALGGDGTVLYASWLFQRVVPPVLAFALGSLGFLTKFDYDLYAETLNRAFIDGITVSLRLRFEATVMRSQRREATTNDRDIVEELIGEENEDNHTHRPDDTHNILNEIVIDRGPNPTMSTLEVFGDNEHFTTVQADGICVATPTGSTAYNLAAGGSLCHPDNPVILVTAICAHTLSFRPIILPDTIVLRIGVPYDARTSTWASFDGRERVELKPGDYVTISASRFPFPSVLPVQRHGEDWIDSISRTLNWNSRQRQKAFDEGKRADGSVRRKTGGGPAGTGNRRV